MQNFKIEVSLVVFKALTARLVEGQTHDDVLRDLLEIDSALEPEAPVPNFMGIGEALSRSFAGETSGFRSRGLWLPNGTKLRARHKQRLYEAEISDDFWIDPAGAQHGSPSSAASAITGTTVNGLKFWEAQRPSDRGWRRLDALVRP